MESWAKLGGTKSWTSPEERLQHDIEELERGSGWMGALRVLAVLTIAIGVGVALYVGTGGGTEKKVVKMTAKGGIVLDTIEPAAGKLDAAPTRFRWESAIGRSDYVFRLVAKGVTTPVVDRVVRENSAELTASEIQSLEKGTTYIWQVQARGKDGAVLGTARGLFEL